MQTESQFQHKVRGIWRSSKSRTRRRSHSGIRMSSYPTCFKAWFFDCLAYGTPIIHSGSQLDQICRMHCSKWSDVSREMTLYLLISNLFWHIPSFVQAFSGLWRSHSFVFVRQKHVPGLLEHALSGFSPFHVIVWFNGDPRSGCCLNIILCLALNQVGYCRTSNHIIPEEATSLSINLAPSEMTSSYCREWKQNTWA